MNRKGTYSGGYLVIDNRKCQGCLTCMLACSLAHHGVADPARSMVQVTQNSFNRYPRDVTSAPVQTCDFCAHVKYWDDPGQPACVTLCPVGAIRFSATLPDTDEQGAYRINFRGTGWKKIGYETD